MPKYLGLFITMIIFPSAELVGRSLINNKDTNYRVSFAAEGGGGGLVGGPWSPPQTPE